MTKDRICANDTGSPKINRRTLLAAIPASSGALAFPVVGMASQKADPILPLYREWCDARAEWIHYSEMPGNEDWKWPESTDSAAREDAAFFRMIDMTPVSMEGLAALAHVHWDTDGPVHVETRENFTVECNQSGNKLMAAIWRGASGQNGLPRR